MPTNLIKKQITCLLLLINFTAIAQDAILSQPHHNLFFTNPAFVGTFNGGRFNSFYRQQWKLLDSPFSQYGITYDQSISKYNSGLGISFSNNISGIITSPSVSLAYGYKFEIKRKLIISLGLQAGITQKYLNLSKLVFADDIDDDLKPSAENIKTGYNKTYADFGFGSVLFYKKLHIGLAIHHLSQPQTSINEDSQSSIKMKFTGQVGYAIKLKKRTRRNKHFLMPFIAVQMQGLQHNIMWGTSMRYNSLLMGLFVRNDISNADALILSLGFEKKQMRFVYSYDINIGKNTTKMVGSHEVTLAILFKIKQRKRRKAVSCPTFLK